MKLREDSDPYCMLWVGVLLLGAYYFNFLYRSYTLAGYITTMTPYLMPLTVIPLVLVVTLIGYLRPARSRVKPTMLALSAVLGLFIVVFSLLVPPDMGGGVFLASWGIGAALLTAGGFSIMHPLEDSVTPGMMDVSALHYGPPAEEAPSGEAPEQTG